MPESSSKVTIHLSVFSRKKNITMLFRDMAKPINVLTGLDYWLDNLMCKSINNRYCSLLIFNFVIFLQVMSLKLSCAIT